MVGREEAALNTVSLTIQVTLSVILLAAVSLTALFWLAPPMGAGLAVWWLALNAGYARALGGRERSARRTRRDHYVSVQGLVGAALPVMTGLAAWEWSALRLVDSGAWSIVVAAAAFIPWAMFMSSLVDWYYVRPRLDGIVCEPPCRAHEAHGRWLRLTRVWFLHRWLAALSVGIASLMFIAACIVAILQASGASWADPSPEIVTLAIGAGLTAFAALFHDWIREMRVGTKWALWLQKPPFVVGDELVGDDRVAGYLRDVSAVQVTVVRDRQESGGLDVYPVPLTVLQTSTATRRASTQCTNGCGGLNREKEDGYDPKKHQCEWDPRRLAATGRRHTLIL